MILKVFWYGWKLSRGHFRSYVPMRTLNFFIFDQLAGIVPSYYYYFFLNVLTMKLFLIPQNNFSVPFLDSSSAVSASLEQSYVTAAYVVHFYLKYDSILTWWLHLFIGFFYCLMTHACTGYWVAELNTSSQFYSLLLCRVFPRRQQFEIPFRNNFDLPLV